MTPDEGDGAAKKKKSRLRYLVQPAFGNPFSRLKRDWSEMKSSFGNAGTSFRFALGALKKHPPICPKCGEGHTVVLEAIQHDSGAITYVLGCTTCDYTESIDYKLEEVADQIDQLRVGEKRFLLAAAAAAAFGFVYYFLTSYLFTLIGAMFIAATLLFNALVFRFRVWKIVNGRVGPDQDRRSMLLDWLRQEISQ
jgi:hypothetical protein